MFSLRGKILTLLKEPYTSREVAEILNLSVDDVRDTIYYLKLQRKIKVVSRTKRSIDNFIVNKYQVANLDVIKECKRCHEDTYESVMVKGLCPSCKYPDVSNIVDFDASPVIVSWMQSIINNQKQLIYKLKAENYLLKQELKIVEYEEI